MPPLRHDAPMMCLRSALATRTICLGRRSGVGLFLPGDVGRLGFAESIRHWEGISAAGPIRAMVMVRQSKE